jgi:hypothetical protein
MLPEAPHEWVTVDPGETTGFAYWRGTDLVRADQLPAWEFIDKLWLDCHDKVKLVVIEDWKLYPWVLDEMGWDPCRTPRFIGAITFIARIKGVEIKYQGANIKKNAKAAGAENLFVEPLYPNRHANDAVMHGVYYLATQEGVRVGA